MNRPPIREERSVDEIDLREVFDRIGNFFQRLFNRIGNTITYVLRRWPYFLLLTAAGVALGYFSYQRKQPYYKSSVTFAPTKIRNEYLEGQIDRLSTLVLEENAEMVAAELNIKTEIASKIRSINYSNLDQDRTSEDSVMMGSPFRLDVELYDNRLFGNIQQALKDHLENNPYFAATTRARRAQLEKMISKLQLDIASIDSAKRAAIALSGPVNGFVYGEPLDPTDLYRQSVELLEKQTKMETELRNLQTVQVAVGFTPLLYPTGPNKLLHLIVGGLLAFLVALVLAYRYDRFSLKRRSS